MIRVHHIGTTTVQGPADDMPRPFDPATHIPPKERATGGQEAGFPSEGGREARSPSEAGYSEATGHLQNANVPPTNPDRAQIAALGADPTPADRRSPLEHERDAGDTSRAEIAVPLDLIHRALAVMRECGWHLAPGSAGDGDGILEIAAAEIEAEFAQLAASAAPDPDTNADCRQPLDPASEVAWLRKIGINSAADLIEALVAECSREFARGYETGRAVGAVEGDA